MNADAILGALASAAVIAAVLGLARWVNAATRREGVSEATSNTVSAALARMDTKLDQLVASIAEMREARVRIETEHAGTVERITRAENRISANAARIDQIDAKHTDARHAQTEHLRGVIRAVVVEELPRHIASTETTDASRSRRRG